MNQFLLALAGAIGTAAVGIVGAWVTQATKNHDKEQLRKRAVNQAQDEISTIDAWVKAHATLSSATQVPDLVQSQARQDLDAAYDKMRRAAAQSPHRRWISLQEVLSRILLRQLHPRGAAKIFRLIYYLSLLMIILWGSVAVSQQKSWTDLGELITNIFVFVVLGIIPAWIFARITIALTRQSEANPPTVPASSPPSGMPEEETRWRGP